MKDRTKSERREERGKQNKRKEIEIKKGKNMNDRKTK